MWRITLLGSVSRKQEMEKGKKRKKEKKKKNYSAVVL